MVLGDTLKIGLLRFVRHGVSPFVILAVEKGWLPQAAQKDTVEFLAIGLSFALAYGWSIWNERNNGRGQLGAEQQSGSVGADGPDGSGSPETPGPNAEEQGKG